MRYLQDSPDNLRAPGDSMFTQYGAEQRGARGLKAGDSLDVRTTYDATGKPTSVVLPLAQAVTTAYAAPIVSDDGTIAALPLDDEPLATRAGVSLATAKDVAQLDPKLQSKLTASAQVQALKAESEKI